MCVNHIINLKVSDATPTHGEKTSDTTPTCREKTSDATRAMFDFLTRFGRAGEIVVTSERVFDFIVIIFTYRRMEILNYVIESKHVVCLPRNDMLCIAVTVLYALSLTII